MNGIQIEKDEIIWDETEVMKWQMDYFKEVHSKKCAVEKLKLKWNKNGCYQYKSPRGLGCGGEKQAINAVRLLQM